MGSGQKVELNARSPCDSGSIKTSLSPLTAAVCIRLLTLLYKSASLLSFSMTELLHSASIHVRKHEFGSMHFGIQKNSETLNWHAVSVMGSLGDMATSYS